MTGTNGKALAWLRGSVLPLALALLGLGPQAAEALAAEDPEARHQADEQGAVAWDRRAAEHLLNRAGFGATPAEVDAAVAAGLDATIDGLFLTPEEQLEVAPPERTTFRDGAPRPGDMERQEAARQMRRQDRSQLADYTGWWFDTMVSGADPLRDRMTLFWHGYFTSSQRDVKSSFQMIQQNQLLRDHALDSFETILFEIAKDPAMLEYLDNDENKKGNPNENFAREVMELFTLGEGHYTEDDIKEAARAFTGWRSRRGEFRESGRQHDGGKKTILGETGRFDGEDVLELLLASEHCAPHVAGRILEYLEGQPPSAARKAQYGEVLRAADYDVGAMLRTLFRDPYFYSDAVVGQRVAGPIDYLVGMSRRLEVLPPRVWLTFGSEMIGQELFNPPNVKGWPGGMAWITTASFMQRGNLAGILLGTVRVGDLIDQGAFGDDMEAMRDALSSARDGEMMDAEAMAEGLPSPGNMRQLGQLARLKRLDRTWEPPLNFAADFARETTPEAVVDALADRLLAVPLPAETRSYLVDEYMARRAEAPASGNRFKDRRQDEELLRSFAHLILSLPEAQLN